MPLISKLSGSSAKPITTVSAAADTGAPTAVKPAETLATNSALNNLRNFDPFIFPPCFLFLRNSLTLDTCHKVFKPENFRLIDSAYHDDPAADSWLAKPPN